MLLELDELEGMLGEDGCFFFFLDEDFGWVVFIFVIKVNKKFMDERMNELINVEMNKWMNKLNKSEWIDNEWK